MTIEIGARVAYSKAFLQSTGQYTGDAPHARGIVTAIVPMGGLTLASVEWDKPDLPGRVNVKNLSTIRRVELGE